MRDLPIPPATSASQLVQFSLCPRKYAFSYVYGFEPAFRSPALILGSATHSAIAWWFAEKIDGRTPTLDQADEVFAADLLAGSAGSVADRVGPLAEELTKLRSLYADDPDGRQYRDLVGGFVDRLRAAWERAVEEVVLNKVVERFDDRVKTQSLSGVICDDETFKAVNDGMGRLSDDTKAHDKGAGHIGTVRSPNDLALSLEALKKLVSDHKKKRKEVADRRDGLRAPPPADIAEADDSVTPMPPQQAPPSAKRVH